jgi:hypothetical protein
MAAREELARMTQEINSYKMRIEEMTIVLNS